MFHRPQPVNLHVRAHPNCKKTGKHLQQRAFFGILYDNAYKEEYFSMSAETTSMLVTFVPLIGMWCCFISL